MENLTNPPYDGNLGVCGLAIRGGCRGEDDPRYKVGPYGERFSRRHDYMAFIADLMPKLDGYAMKLDRVAYVGDARAYAELSETMALDGKPMRTPEVLVFELNGDDRIVRVDVFIQTPEGGDRRVGTLEPCLLSCPVSPAPTTCAHWPGG